MSNQLINYSGRIMNEGGGKKFIKELAAAAVEGLFNDGDDPIHVAVKMAKMETFIKEVRADRQFVDHVLDEISKHGKGRVELFGVKLEQAETGVKYDYSVCGDAVWETLSEQKADIEEHIKSREAFLKAVPPAGMVVLHEPTGEARQIYPPAKSSTTNYKITLPNT